VEDTPWRRKGETIGLRHSYTSYPADLIDYDVEEGYEVKLYINVKSEDGSKADMELWGSRLTPEFEPASNLWPPKDKKLDDREVEWY